MCAAWATHEDACSPCNSYAFTEDELDFCFLIASDILYNLTRRKWPGPCDSGTLRPLARFRNAPGIPRWWPASRHRAGMYPYGFCSCNRSENLGCATVPQIELPNRAVDPTTIVVKIDGNEFTEFRLDDHYKLVRTDGLGWPCCQNILLDDDQPGTFSIAFTGSTGPPSGGVRAAASLGCQLAMLYNPDALGEAKCKLSKRVTQMQRAGTTVTITDPITLFKDGLTGLTEVDLWVASVNRGDGTRRGRLLGTGSQRTVRRTGR